MNFFKRFFFNVKCFFNLYEALIYGLFGNRKLHVAVSTGPSMQERLGLHPWWRRWDLIHYRMQMRKPPVTPTLSDVLGCRRAEG